MIGKIILLLYLLVVAYDIFKGNTAVAIVALVFIAIDYHTWLRSGNSLFFQDRTQIEKDLRELQKLEIAKKIKELKKEGE
jgi:hypothetical protein